MPFMPLTCFQAITSAWQASKMEASCRWAGAGPQAGLAPSTHLQRGLQLEHRPVASQVHGAGVVDTVGKHDLSHGCGWGGARAPALVH